MEEKWKKIKGYERYEISNTGRLRRKLMTGKYRYIEGHKMSRGYVQVILYGSPNHSTLMHVLVAKYFVENADDYWTVKHINGDNSDNRASNLEWCGCPSIIRLREKKRRES